MQFFFILRFMQIIFFNSKLYLYFFLSEKQLPAEHAYYSKEQKDPLPMRYSYKQNIPSSLYLSKICHMVKI